MIHPPLRLVFDVQGSLREAARECEAEVFLARFGNTRPELDEAYGRYEEHTHFLAVVDQSGRVFGATRLIFPGPAGLKTLDDVASPPWNIDPVQAAQAAGLDPAHTLDLTTMAVRDELREREFAASHAMLYGMFAAMRMNEIRSVVVMVDSVPGELLRRIGLVFSAIPGTSSRPYFGSTATVPSYAHLEPLLAAQERLAPQVYPRIRHGHGLRGVAVPPLEELRLPRDW